MNRDAEPGIAHAQATCADQAMFWTGIVLTPEEMQTLRSRANNTEHKAAARVIAGLPKRGKPGGN